MNLRLNIILKIGLLTPFLGPIGLFILSEIFKTDTFKGTVVGLMISYLPILFMGVIFSIPITMVLSWFYYIIKKVTNNDLLIRGFILIAGCLLIIGISILLGYNLIETEDLIWPLSYCITILGLLILMKDGRTYKPNEVRL